MTIQELAEGRIAGGKRRQDDIVRVVLIASTILSFVIGFASSSLMITMSTFALCTVALSLVVLPPWPMFNHHPVTWLSVQGESQK
ncbi:microsomal signal peptidase 12kDa subunit [Suillus occidentalis]|nr:microsomal signal peptidase 12kDa subunit [Suillus occidentalis]